MIVPLYPPLEGEAAERFPEFAAELMTAQQAGNRDAMQASLAREVKWCRSGAAPGTQALLYEACVQVLTDLVRMRWRIFERGYGFALENPKEVVRGRPTAELVASKRMLREELRPVVSEQQRHPAVRDFIKKMESNNRFGKKPVTLLMADGAELAARLAPALAVDGSDRATALAAAVQPYLQLADQTIDHVTGRTLREIWRYFRYSWSIPQVPTPGRQLLYLVRDAAHANHPVIGIAGLNNCPLEMGEVRETFIGWHRNALVGRFAAAAAQGEKALELEVEWIEYQIDQSLAEVCPTNLATADELANPDAVVLRRLSGEARAYADAREEILRERAGGEEESFDSSPWDLPDSPPVDDAVLALEPKASSDLRMHAARKQLVAKKRATAISRLLSARMALKEHREALLDPKRAVQSLEIDELRSALHIVVEALKGRRAGANMLEITTCGAIAPYSRLLGGKLVALMMLSPEVADDYRKAYGKPSIISSQMRNEPVVRDNTLVYLGTTSLYVHGSSQYNRLRLPAGLISESQQEIAFRPIGQTSGFGTLQFSADTSRAIDALLAADQDFREVNSVFGEGTSPKLRKIKMGLRRIGFDPDKLMQHRQHRLIYAIPFFDTACDWLIERNTELPPHVANPGSYRDASARIADYWRRRWLAARLNHNETVERLPLDQFSALGEKHQAY